jgi:hypothetical protein
VLERLAEIGEELLQALGGAPVASDLAIPAAAPEGMRSKLKRLVGRGWLVESEPGLFAPAEGVAGALDGAALTPQGRDDERGSSS